MVDGRRVATSQAHGSNGAFGAAAGLGVTGNVVHATDDTGVGTTALVVKNLDTIELSLFGNTVAFATNGTSAVSPMAVAISLLTADEALKKSGATLKLLDDIVKFPTPPYGVLAAQLTGWAASIPVSIIYTQVPSPALSS